MDSDTLEKMQECIANQMQTLKLLGASLTNAKTKANEYEYRPNKQGNKIAKQYNLMRLMTGGQPISTFDNDTSGPTEGLKYYGGSTNVDKSTTDKVDKSYRLMRLLTGSR